ncbi:MAG: hypothetical protein ACLRTA_00375 [Clostridia bacterium]
MKALSRLYAEGFYGVLGTKEAAAIVPVSESEDENTEKRKTS